MAKQKTVKVSYEPAVKSMIVKTVKEILRANGTWKEAHEAAQGGGYKSSIPALKKWVKESDAQKKTGKASKTTGGGTKKRAGRPKGSKNKPKGGGWVGNRRMVTTVPPFKKSSDILTDAVNQAYNEAIDKAIAALQAQKR